MLFAVSLTGCTSTPDDASGSAMTVTQTVTETTQAPSTMAMDSSPTASSSQTATKTSTSQSSSQTATQTSSSQSSSSSPPSGRPGLSGTYSFHQIPQPPTGYVGDIRTYVDDTQGNLVGQYGPNTQEWNRFMYRGNTEPVHIAASAAFTVSFSGTPDPYDE